MKNDNPHITLVRKNMLMSLGSSEAIGSLGLYLEVHEHS